MFKLVILDDDIWVRRSLKSCINWEKLGIVIVGEESDGLNGLKMILKQKPDIVIIDIKMPGISGLDVIKQTKPKLSQTIFIILSGYGEFNLAQQALRLGAYDYILKPADGEYIKGVILNAIKSLEKSKLDTIKYDVKYIVEIRKIINKEFIFKLKNMVECYNTKQISTIINSVFKEFTKFYSNNEFIYQLVSELMSLLDIIAKDNNVSNKYENGKLDKQVLNNFDKAEEFIIKMAISLSKNIYDNNKCEGRQIVQKIVSHIKEYYYEDISLKTLSEKYHFNSSYISRIFKEEIGQTLSEFLISIRINKAKQLLKEKKYKIYEV